MTFYTTDRTNAHHCESGDRRTQFFTFRPLPLDPQKKASYDADLDKWILDLTDKKKAKSLGAALFRYFREGILSDPDFSYEALKPYEDMCPTGTITSLKTKYIIHSAKRKVLIINSLHDASKHAYRLYQYVATGHTEGTETIPPWSSYKVGKKPIEFTHPAWDTNHTCRLMPCKPMYDLYTKNMEEKERKKFTLEVYVSIVSRQLGWQTPQLKHNALETGFLVEENFNMWVNSNF